MPGTVGGRLAYLEKELAKHSESFKMVFEILTADSFRRHDDIDARFPFEKINTRTVPKFGAFGID